MRILKIEEYFQSEETLDKVLEEIKEDITMVDEYADMMKQNMVATPEAVSEALKAITGIYSNLRTVLALAETEKKNREIRRYGEIRIETENSGKKFTDASASKEASEFVASYRRVRNLIQGYVESCEKMSSALQSDLRKVITEMSLTVKGD